MGNCFRSKIAVVEIKNRDKLDVLPVSLDEALDKKLASMQARLAKNVSNLQQSRSITASSLNARMTSKRDSLKSVLSESDLLEVEKVAQSKHVKSWVVERGSMDEEALVMHNKMYDERSHVVPTVGGLVSVILYKDDLDTNGRKRKIYFKGEVINNDPADGKFTVRTREGVDYLILVYQCKWRWSSDAEEVASTSKQTSSGRDSNSHSSGHHPPASLISSSPVTASANNSGSAAASTPHGTPSTLPRKPTLMDLLKKNKNPSISLRNNKIKDAEIFESDVANRTISVPIFLS